MCAETIYALSKKSPCKAAYIVAAYHVYEKRLSAVVEQQTGSGAVVVQEYLDMSAAAVSRAGRPDRCRPRSRRPADTHSLNPSPLRRQLTSYLNTFYPCESSFLEGLSFQWDQFSMCHCFPLLRRADGISLFSTEAFKSQMTLFQKEGIAV